MKSLRSAERFLEETCVPCILIRAKFDLDSEGHRVVRIDFETPVREAYKFIPENIQTVYDSMGNAGAVNTKFGIEFSNRMIELSFDPKKRPVRIIDATSITKIELRRKDTEHEMKLRFSVTEAANSIGHWVVDHFGDPMHVRAIHAQLSMEA